MRSWFGGAGLDARQPVGAIDCQALVFEWQEAEEAAQRVAVGDGLALRLNVERLSPITRFVLVDTSSSRPWPSLKLAGRFQDFFQFAGSSRGLEGLGRPVAIAPAAPMAALPVSSNIV